MLVCCDWWSFGQWSLVSTVVPVISFTGGQVLLLVVKRFEISQPKQKVLAV